MLQQFTASPWRQMARDSVLAIAMTACAGLATAEYLGISVAPAHPYASQDGTLGSKSRMAGKSGDVGELQAAIDASPHMGSRNLQASAALKVAVPLPRPKLAQVHSDRPAGETTANVTRFDRCLPQCESQDRLLIPASAGASEAYAPIQIADDDEEIGPVRPYALPRLLSRVISAPVAVYRHGRAFATHIEW